MKNVIATQEAPAAVGPYSQAIVAGDFLYVSGQIALDPATGVLVSDDVQDQMRQVLKNVQAILHQAGCDAKAVVKTTLFITDIADFARVNEVYGTVFEKDAPARSCMAVAGLPKGAKVEMEVVAYLK